MDSRPQTLDLKKLLTTSAQGPHPFPFRTGQLSPAAPMVLPLRGGGRVGRRQPFLWKPRQALLDGAFACAPPSRPLASSLVPSPELWTPGARPRTFQPCPPAQALSP